MKHFFKRLATLPLLLLVISLAVSFLLWYTVAREAHEIQPLVPALQSWWMKLHVPANFIGYGTFALAAMVGLAYLLKAALNADCDGQMGLLDLAGNVLTPMKPCSFAAPPPGIAADVVDDQGQPVRNQNTVAKWSGRRRVSPKRSASSIARIAAWSRSTRTARAAPRESASRPSAATTSSGRVAHVTSTSGATVQCFAIASSTVATVAGSISEGVPPPKKIEETVRPGVRAASKASSVASARAKRA